MGDHNVNIIEKKSRAKFIKHLLNDVDALEYMLNNNMIEKDITRIGAEQEFCLVDSNWRPSTSSSSILIEIDDDHFTTELAKFNLEINLDPVVLENKSFSKVEMQLEDLLAKADNIAAKHQAKILLTGILPSISKNELQFEFMTPNPRYWALNDMIKELKGSDIELYIRGVDQLSILHDSVLFEACNTSFQMHLQIAPNDFISSYNWAQAISGPILSVCCNSPLLLGRELWSETRIALFQQSIDTRSSSYALKDQQARVTFGEKWESRSVATIFKDDIANHKIILSKDELTDSLESLKNNKMPKLEALCLHNGTVYRWNRPCYGVAKNKAHLRIENRYIPSGPTVLDEMANFAFWVGLMIGRPSEFDKIHTMMDFKDAKDNFIRAARTGKNTMLNWMGEWLPASKLVLNKLLPIAYSGLKKHGILEKDIERFLKVIELRAKGRTGAEWLVEQYRMNRKIMKKDDALLAVTKKAYENQKNKLPVHSWAKTETKRIETEKLKQVRHIMSTQLFTINYHDSSSLAASIMEWKNIHHLPVENDSSELCGLLTWEHLEEYKNHKDSPVSEIMVKKLITVSPETTISDAKEIMIMNEIGCLLVIQHKKLIGIITKKDIDLN